MVIYLDESYDNHHRYLLLGALFLPDSKPVVRKMIGIRAAAAYCETTGGWREIKYNNCYRECDYRVASEVVDLFFSEDAWYRCIVVDQTLLDLKRFGAVFESDVLKRARAYKKFCELLIGHNSDGIEGGVLLAERMTRCRGDRFVEVMGEAFCRPGVDWSAGHRVPILRHVQEVDSKIDTYIPLQMCDLLTGCILNDLVPAENPWKNKIRRYLLGKLGMRDFAPGTWRRRLRWLEPKFNVWHWRPGSPQRKRPR